MYFGHVLTVVPSRVFMRSSRRLESQAVGRRRLDQRLNPDEHLDEIRFPLPPLPEQRRIAEVLDRAEALRAKRRAALAQLDTLTQSIFLDMFGDPATNPKGWPTQRARRARRHGARSSCLGRARRLGTPTFRS